MLLFAEPTLDGSWGERRRIADEIAGLEVYAGVDCGRHTVSLSQDASVAGETVAPSAPTAEVDPVSSFHLPPYYRWEQAQFDCRFAAEWREGGPSITVALRHLRSLGRHPRALLADDPDREPSLDGAAASALVVGTPAISEHPETSHPAVRIDWRGWHVIDTEDPFAGPTRWVLATHTEVWISQPA